jgi:hypothetical protein
MTAFVPGFENDLFISYAHEDDKRWVQAFQDELHDDRKTSACDSQARRRCQALAT